MGHRRVAPRRGRHLVGELSSEYGRGLRRYRLDADGLQVVGGQPQVELGSQLVGRMPPVPVLEQSQLTGIHERLELRLHCGQRGIGGLGREGADHVDIVETVQHIEPEDVIVQQLRALQQVAHQPCVGRDGDAGGILQRHGRVVAVGRGADTAHPVGVVPRVHPGTILHDHLESPEERAGGPGVNHFPVVDLYFYTKVTLYPGDRIDDNLGHYASFSSTTVSSLFLPSRPLAALTPRWATIAAPVRAARPMPTVSAETRMPPRPGTGTPDMGA